MSSDPSKNECPVPMTVPGSSDLMLRCWELRLNSSPDARQGERPSFPVPSGVDAGYLAIVWEGEVVIDGTRYGAGSCDSRVAVIGSGQEITLVDANSARLALLGVDEDIMKLGPLSRGAHPFLDVADGQAEITFLLRILDFSGVQGPVALEEWPRPGFLLSTTDGPGFGKRQPSGSGEISELDFVLLAPGAPYLMGPGDADQKLAFILDYHVDGDNVVSGNVDGDENCKIRCWGGLASD